MSSKKKSLGTVVECAEGPEESSSKEETTSVDGKFIDDRASSGEGSSVLPHKKRWNGSRLSLASLFTFSTMAQRERARTSCGADSHSSGDLRNFSLSSHNISNRRFAMNDLESCSMDATDSSDDPLLINDGEIIDQNGKKMRECPLCYMRQPIHNFPKLIGCNHRSCRLCLMQYVELEIMENRVEVTCPECSAHLHPSDVALLVGGRTALIEKYEQFSLRRFLMTEPDTRFCPAPDCQYAVIASGCAACPQLKCARDECGTLFCYHCKGVWHANQTCDEARRQRGPNKFRLQRLNSGSIDAQLKPGDIKACPRCRTYIVKMDDGSCNHMVCAMCSAEFCWLCLKEISDLHYLSPTGCTFWGKKPWTRKKKLLWQLGTLIGAPVGIALIAGLSIPGIIFGVPVFVGRKVHQRFSQHTKTRRRLITAACVAGSLVVSPVLAVMAVGVGVPIMLAYVYGVVPLSLCRNGGCGLRESQSMSNLENIDEEELYNASGIFGSHEKSQLLVDGESRADGQSLGPALSMQSGFSQSTQPTRLTVHNETRTRRQSVESGVASLGERANYEEASTKAMVGSQYHYDDKSVHTVCSAGQEALSYSEDVASTKALAGSVIDAKSLSGSMGARHVVSRADTVERERSEHPHDEKEDQPCSTKSLIEETPSGGLKSKRLSSSSRQQVVHMNVHGDDGNEIMILSEEAAAEIGALAASGDRESTTSATTEHDPFRIRTLMDTMKQMTAVDEAADHSAPPAPRPSGIGRLRRSNSSRSEATIENGISSPARAGKRRFFGLLPPKSARK